MGQVPVHPFKSTTHQERYYHFQVPPVEGLRIKAITVFTRQERDTSDWYGAFSFCSANDQFNKRIGRTVSRRKFFLSKEHRFLLGHDTLSYDAVAGVAFQLARDFQAGSPKVRGY